MSITVGSNIAALLAARRLSQAGGELSQTFQRLSSGLRINSAADDAAGLAVAMGLNAQVRIASVAIRNANDGISALSIQDSALESISHILMRMAELAEQSATATYSLQQRSPIQAEFAALGSEIERIATITNFNRIALLSGGSSITLQVGFDSYSTSQLALRGIQGTLQGLSLALSGSSDMIYSVIATTIPDSQAAARTALDAVKAAIETVDVGRGMIGASESRLHHAVNNLSTQRAEFSAAESRIRDIDVAEESAKLISAQIRQQAAAAILAQANQQPALVLKLLDAGPRY